MTVHRQRRVPGGRTPVQSAFIQEIERAIAREMTKYRCSRSFVIATAVAFAFGIEEQEDYRPVSPRVAKRAALTRAADAASAAIQPMGRLRPFTRDAVVRAKGRVA